jgi:hypothetical protein
MISKYITALLMLRNKILESEIYYMQNLDLEDGMELSRGGHLRSFHVTVSSILTITLFTKYLKD